jgi:hypothetical protein
MAKTKQTFKPEQIADQLKLSGKNVRAYLRKTYPRPADAKGSSWTLTEKQANDTLAYFRARAKANA